MIIFNWGAFITAAFTFAVFIAFMEFFPGNRGDTLNYVMGAAAVFCAGILEFTKKLRARLFWVIPVWLVGLMVIYWTLEKHLDGPVQTAVLVGIGVLTVFWAFVNFLLRPAMQVDKKERKQQRELTENYPAHFHRVNSAAPEKPGEIALLETRSSGNMHVIRVREDLPWAVPGALKAELERIAELPRPFPKESRHA